MLLQSFKSILIMLLYDLVDDFCIVYLDDILVFSKIKEEHYQHLELLLNVYTCRAVCQSQKVWIL
jgi:hypothetical protein